MIDLSPFRVKSSNNCSPECDSLFLVKVSIMKPVFESNGFVEEFTLGAGELRFAVKDTLDIAGRPTRAGCPALADAPKAKQHARIVKVLLNSGCQLTGKTTLHELAFGVTGSTRGAARPLILNTPR